VELADLTRDIRKNIFLVPGKMFFFAKPGLSEFHKSSAEKHILEPEKMFFRSCNQAKPQPFAARAKRENEKAKCFAGKGPVA